MGRGRAKAKQTKVARDLKYRTHETDFGALANELHGDKDENATTTRPGRAGRRVLDDAVATTHELPARRRPRG